MRRGGRAVAATAVVALLLATVGGCGGSSGSGSGPGSGSGDEAVPVPNQYAVGTRFETFIDASRPTEGRGDVAPPKPSRTFETFIYYPAEGRLGGEPVTGARAATAKGPFPLVVFSHGSGVSSPVRYDLLFRWWAAAGYVVVAPKYPLSSTSLPDSGADLVNQPTDISFLITELLRSSEGLIDGDRIAAAGHSLGAVTSLAVGFNRCCVDPRIRAGVVLAGAQWGFPADGWFPGPGSTPLLVVHGDEDKLIRLADAQQLFQDAPPPKTMLTVFGGDHNRPYGGSLATVDNPERLGATLNGPTRLVNATVVAFFDRYLKDRPTALTRLGSTLADEVSVKLEVVER